MLLRRSFAQVGLLAVMAAAVGCAWGGSGAWGQATGPHPSESALQLVGPGGGSYYDVDPAHMELIHDAYWIWWDRDSNAVPAEISAAPFTFTREFKLDGAVERAILEATAQGAYTLWVNDQEVGGGKQWDEMETYDIAPYLKGGVNHVRITVTSDHWIRGLFVVATVELAGGRRVEILSDSSWEVSSALAQEPRAAEPVVRGINGGPWNNAARLQVMPPQFYGLNTELKVPGIAWGQGYAGEKPKVLAVLARTQQRDLVELVQRMDMDLTVAFTTITQAGTHAPFFPAIDGAREEDVRRRLEKVLQDDYDVVILGSVPGGIFAEVMAERLQEMVREGTGLVCPSVPGGLREQLTQTPVEGEQAPAFLRTGTPFAQLPGFKLGEGDPEGYQRVASLYKCGEGRVVELRLGGLLADVPDPVELHYEYYISFALRSLLWAAGREPAVELVDMPTTVRAAYGDAASLKFAISGEGTYEVKAAVRSPELLSRAPRVPTVRPGVHEFAAVLEPVYETQLSVRAGEEARLELPALPAGDYYVDLMVESRGERVGWAVVHLAVDGEARVAQLAIDPSYIDVADGKRAELTARATLSKDAPDGSTVRFQVIDNHERVVAEQEARAGADRLAEAKFVFDEFATTLGRVRAELLIGGKTAHVAVARFTAVRRDWDRFFFIIYGGTGSGGRKTSIVHSRVFTGLGVDAIRHTIPTLESLETADMLAVPSHGGYHRGTITMEPEELERRREGARKTAERAIPFDPLTYTVDDEITYGGGGLEPHRILHFRDLLRKSYGSIEALNAQWEADYNSFDEIYPLGNGTVPEARPEMDGSEEAEAESPSDFLEHQRTRNTHNYSRWVDQWRANIDAWYEYPRQARKGVQQADPHGRVGTGCPMWPHASSGHDWYQNMRVDGFEMFAPYGRDGEIQPYEEGRSFAKSDAFLGMYYGGYLYNAFVRREQQTDLEWQRWRVWTALLRGYTSIWWYSGGAGNREDALGSGLMPYSSFQTLGDQIERIRNGYYTLLERNRAIRDYGPVAVHYSIASRLTAPELGLGGDSFARNWDVHFLHRIIQDHLGHQYSFLSGNQITAGALKDYKVLFLPLSVALGDEELDGIRAFAEAGGLVIADARAGIADGHGRLRRREALEALLGIRYEREHVERKMVTGQLSGSYRGVAIENAERRFPADSSVRLAGAEAEWVVDGVPVLTHHRVGKGTAVSLNVPFNYYQGYSTPDHLYYYIGEPGHNRLIGNILHAVFKAHKIERLVHVEVPDGGWLDDPDVIWRYRTENWLPGLEVPYHRDGEAQYVSLTKRRVGRRETGPYPVTVRVPQAGHIYDLFAGKYLGEGDRWTAQVNPADVQIFAVLPYRVKGLKVTLEAGRVERGRAIKGHVAVQAGAADGDFVRHVTHVEAQRPGGETPSYLRRMLETDADGRAEFDLPLALNEPAGQWTLTFTDMASGQRRQVRVEVE